MKRTAKGKKPIYFNNPENDKLLTIILTLAQEVSVLRERLDTWENIASAKGLILKEEIEKYQPDVEVMESREKWRQEYLSRLLRVVQDELQQTIAHNQE